jgi:hypothetical protein
MKNFAEIQFGRVVNIIVSEENPNIDGSNFIEFVYDGSIRKNPAVIGGQYDESNDAFIDPKPYPSWLLNSSTFKWESPIGDSPSDGVYRWNEEEESWLRLS